MPNRKLVALLMDGQDRPFTFAPTEDGWTWLARQPEWAQLESQDFVEIGLAVMWVVET